MLEFKKIQVLKNGGKLTKNNWQKVVAISSRPNTTNKGWPEIEKIRKETGAYYDQWQLKKESEGYIFREVNHNGGISGNYPTAKQAIFAALRYEYISVFLED